MANPAETHWQREIGNREVKVTPADRAAAEAEFVAKNGHAPATAAEREQFRAAERDIAQNKYNDAIEKAVTAHPIVSAPVLKSLLYQESNLNGAEGGRTYVGIAQLGAGEARGAGLRVDRTVDERRDPVKAIGAAAATLEQKDREMQSAYRHYGRPEGDDHAKFTTAAYNGGAGTISRAMHLAHDVGLAQAQAQGLTGERAQAFANQYATKFDNLIEPKDNIEQSPLYKAADRLLTPLGAEPHEKYREISHYADDIVARASQGQAHHQDLPAPHPNAPHPSAPVPVHHGSIEPPATAPLRGFHIGGELVNGRASETRAELAEKNETLQTAIASAKDGFIEDVRFESNGRIGEKALAAQNEVLHRAILTNLPESMREAYAKQMHLEPGPRIVGEQIEGRPVETHAVLEMKNAKIQTAIALAHQGWIDGSDFKAVGQESPAEVKRQNDILHDTIASNLPERERAAYRKQLEAPTHAAAPPAHGTPASAPPHVAPTHGAPTTGAQGGAYDRTETRREVGQVPLGTASDLTDPTLTKRALVDAMGNLEAHAGVPITVSVINTGHHSDAVDNVHTHGHKGGYAADLYVDRNHDSPAARLKLVNAIASDPYVTKVGLGGDYKSAEYTRILEKGGKIVFADNDQSHIHVQAQPDERRLLQEERGDTTRRPGIRADKLFESVRESVQQHNQNPANRDRQLPEPRVDAAVRPWDDGKTQPSSVNGTAVRIQGNGETEYAIAIHGGRGSYVVIDPQRDSGVAAQFTPELIGQRVNVSSQGIVTPSENTQTLQRA